MKPIDNLSIETPHFYAGKDGSESTDEFSESSGYEGLVLKPTNLTILVGPNNSGKSQTLREIYYYLVGDYIDRKVLKEITEKYPENSQEFIDLLRQFETQPIGQGEINQVASGQTILARPDLSDKTDRTAVNLGSMAAWFDAKHNKKDQAFLNLRRQGLKFFAVFLDAQTRLSLSKEQSSGPLEESPRNHLWYLFTNSLDAKRVRDECEAAFSGLFFIVDPTGMIKYRIRMSTEKPDASLEKGLGEKNIEYYQNASLISELGDGVKCYVGMIAAVVALKNKFLFIDDPEAFLHPPVARQLGQSLTKLTNEYGTQLFISTHSSDFVLGCLEESQQCNVVRLTYSPSGQATATLLDNEVLLEWKRKPILRSTNVLNGLFHSSVVVTEGDSDRVFYEEINRRLVDKARGVRDCEFLRAQNLDTIYKIIGPLNRTGLPVAGIVDVDILYTNSENEVKNSLIRKLLEASCAEEKVRRDISSQADRIIERLKANQIPFDDFKKNGLELQNLSEQIKDDIREIIKNLDELGIFVVPNGALESWLKDLNIIGQGGEWVANCFDKLGYNPESPTYVHPSQGDIWEFLERISEYIRRKERR